MPTTYTNGLKLPDLGSIDWFASYKNNIDILDPIVGTVNGVATTYAPISHNHSASEITSGTIDIARLPPAALERMHIVADQTARYALTTSTVQEGDTVKQTDTGVMYLVVDSTKLDSADGYTEYSAGTASKAIADEDGTSIKTGYVNRTTNQSIAGQKTFTDNTFFTTNVYHKNTTYESGNIPSSNIVTNIYLADKSNVYTGYVRSVLYTSGRTATEIRAKNIFKNGVLDPTGADISSNLNVEVQPNGTKTIYWDGLIRNDVTPFTTNNNSLGSSSYQWSSIYAQSYYYNGTQWGLDKANVWSTTNTYTYSLGLKQTNLEEGEFPASAQTRRFTFTDKNNASLGWLQHRLSTSGDSYLELYVVNKFSNGQLSTQGSEIANVLNLGLHSDGSRYCTVTGDVSPDLPGRVCNLGTSANKWKTLNGVNPGALSLPNYSDTTYIDISGSIVPPSGETTINYSGGENQYTPPVDGWLSIRCDGATFLQIYRNAYNCPGTTASRQTASGKLVVTLPVLKNTTYTIKINTSGSTNLFHLYPCLGNV